MITYDATAEDAGQRLDHVVQRHLPDQSRSRIQQWIGNGRVRVNGSPAKASRTVRLADRIDVEPEAPPPLHAEAEDIPLEILFEDEHLAAIDKPAGMVVHAGAGIHSGTMTNALLHHFESLSGVGGPVRPGIVHRLDRFTSGVILVAKTDAVHRALAAQFSGRTVEKTYLALVHGQPAREERNITEPIERDPVHRTRMTARTGEGRHAVTHYRVLRRFQAFAYLEVTIGTGRTHQIRVHLSHIGHPIAGDTLYGAPARTEGRPPLDRFFLHAWRIRFDHPVSGERMELTAPLPAVLEAWMSGLL